VKLRTGNEHPKKVMELLIEFAQLMGDAIDFPISSRLFDKLKLGQVPSAHSSPKLHNVACKSSELWFKRDHSRKVRELFI
jgi:hypothetical protein